MAEKSEHVPVPAEVLAIVRTLLVELATSATPHEDLAAWRASARILLDLLPEDRRD